MKPKEQIIKINNSDGIEFHKAMSILSMHMKTKRKGDYIYNIRKMNKYMGQTLELFESKPNTCKTNKFCDIENFNEKMCLIEKHTIDLKKNISNISVIGACGLFRMLFYIQSIRVSTYNSFDKSLEYILSTQNIVFYQSVVSRVTVLFFNQSKCIMKIKNMLLEEQYGINKKVAQWITNLQNLEKKKLNLTASMHLSRIRECDELGILEKQSDVESANNETGNFTASKMLREEIIALDSKLRQNVAKINEILEELRCVFSDLSN